jgi:MEMO1 family protein
MNFNFSKVNKNNLNNFLLLTIVIIFISVSVSEAQLKKPASKEKRKKVRVMVDTVGYASKPAQFDDFMRRVDSIVQINPSNSFKTRKYDENNCWKAAICPHDDYSYVGSLYPALLEGIKAKTVIIFGVAHKAKEFEIEEKIIFDDFNHWSQANGKVRVSPYRETIMSKIPKEMYEINDSMQSLEHSVEPIVNFLQYYNRNVHIISILIPYMSYNKMNKISGPLSIAIKDVMTKNNLKFGKDIAFIMSSDAVHYGDEDWGGKNFAKFGTDSAGYNQAVDYDKDEIINKCLSGNISTEKIQRFVYYTVLDDNHKEYKWTWCGRYSIPFGLLTTFKLEKLLNEEVKGELVGYSTSIDHNPIPVKDIGMGITAPANLHHWVGYPAIGYK